MYPKIKIQGDEAKVKFPSSSFLIKTENIDKFEEKLKELIEEFAL